MGVIVLLSLLTSLALSAAHDDCLKNPDICDDNQCCLMTGSTTGQAECANLTLENGSCETTPQTHPSNADVYMTMCPCGEDLSCAESGDQDMMTCLYYSDPDMSDMTYEVEMV